MFSYIKADKYSIGFREGYEKAMKEINTPMQVIIQDKWSHTICPRCQKTFSDHEENDDGYITRCKSMERCPFCGQKIKWY